MKRNLRLSDDNAEIEKELSALAPGQHGLTMLPLFAGERSTGWKAEARAAVTGLCSNTSAIQILQAALESVALRFRNVYEIMEASIGKPKEVVASGSALLHSPCWTQMMADVLSHAVIQCVEPEATSRGAALIALERIGAIGNIRDLAARRGNTIQPQEGNQKVYMDSLARQRTLYRKLFEEAP